MADDMNSNIQKLMQEAQKMQKKMQDAQKELANLTIIGESGGGLVKVTMNGQHYVSKVDVNQNMMDEDKEMLEDLLAAAVNDAVRKVEAASKSKITDLTSGLNIPSDFKLPPETDEK